LRIECAGSYAGYWGSDSRDPCRIENGRYSLRENVGGSKVKREKVVKSRKGQRKKLSGIEGFPALSRKGII